MGFNSGFKGLTSEHLSTCSYSAVSGTDVMLAQSRNSNVPKIPGASNIRDEYLPNSVH